jgi:hypothetical protein
MISDFYGEVNLFQIANRLRDPTQLGIILSK